MYLSFFVIKLSEKNKKKCSQFINSLVPLFSPYKLCMFTRPKHPSYIRYHYRKSKKKTATIFFVPYVPSDKKSWLSFWVTYSCYTLSNLLEQLYRLSLARRRMKVLAAKNVRALHGLIFILLYILFSNSFSSSESFTSARAWRQVLDIDFLYGPSYVIMFFFSGLWFRIRVMSRDYSDESGYIILRYFFFIVE